MRLIDADALLEQDVDYDRCECLVLRYEVEKAPTIDAVPVVRCKNCKWWNKAGCAISIVDETDKPKADDYCSFGERKDGDSNGTA